MSWNEALASHGSRGKRLQAAWVGGRITTWPGATTAWPRPVSARSARSLLTHGFHDVESGFEGERWRWTDGRAALDASLWQGCQGVFFLRVEPAMPALPRWIGPGEPASVVELGSFKRHV